jgi:hypothetical protein
MPFIFCLLVAWYLVFRAGELFTNTATKLTAWAADKVAAGATRLGDRGRTLAERATAAADTLRNRPTPPTARTRAGEEAASGGRPTEPTPAGGPTAADGGGSATSGGAAPAGGAEATSTGPAGTTGAADTAGPSTTRPTSTTSDQDSEWRGRIGDLITWMRIVWIDACAAAQAAKERRRAESFAGRRWWSPRETWNSWSGWKTSWTGWWRIWLRWPSGDERQAPVQATAERMDRPTQDTPAVAPSTDDNVIDAEIVEPTAAASPTPALPATTAVAALTTGGTAMSVSTDTAPAESGLGSYLSYANDMSSSCANAVSSVETTVANMEGNDWSGEPIAALNAAKDLLAQAQSQFETTHTALQNSLNVRDAYNANQHTGNKESVMSD